MDEYYVVGVMPIPFPKFWGDYQHRIQGGQTLTVLQLIIYHNTCVWTCDIHGLKY